MTDKKSARTELSINALGLRGGFGIALEAVLEESCSLVGEDLRVITPDTSASGGLARFTKNKPNLWIDLGISEQGAVLIAGGLADDFRPIVATFASFLCSRAHEQIKMVSGYMRLPVIYVGYASGIDLSYLGSSHCCLDDIAIMRSLDIVVYTPADARQLLMSLGDALTNEVPAYIRLPSRPKIQKINTIADAASLVSGFEFVKKNAGDRLLISYGSLSTEAIVVADKVDIDLVLIWKVDAFTLRSLVDACQHYSRIFVVEDHVNVTGLCSMLRSLGLDSESLSSQVSYLIGGEFGAVTAALEMDAEGLIRQIRGS